MKSMSPSIELLATAFAKAQKKLKAAPKDRENPYFKSSYATLASIIETIQEPFGENGLSFTQPSRTEGELVFVETMIMHTSGQFMSSEIGVRPVKNDPQALGSALSYLRRYSLQAMVGIASAEEDDDGNAATHQAPPPQRGATPAKEPIFNMNDQKQQEALAGALADRGVDEQFWEVIGKELHGKPKAMLAAIIEKVT